MAMVSNVLPDREKINIDQLIRKDYDLTGHNSMHLHAKAEHAVLCKDCFMLKAALLWGRRRMMPVTILGEATNTIISEKGIKGLTLITTHMKHCHINGVLFSVSAGMLLDKAIDLAIDAGLRGMEMLGGIPGTVGGAIYGNAAANGTAISDHLFYVDWMDAKGVMHRMETTKELFSYRKSPFQSIKGGVICEAGFNLIPTRQTISLKTIKEGARKNRILSHQFDFPSCGCFFKNPEGAHAGMLIEQCGLKGKLFGGAMVSPFHANFIVNTGNATSDELFKLGEDVRETVMRQTGIELQYEVRFIGR